MVELAANDSNNNSQPTDLSSNRPVDPQTNSKASTYRPILLKLRFSFGHAIAILMVCRVSLGLIALALENGVLSPDFLGSGPIGG